MAHSSGSCPVCTKPLLKGEDIVTCPSCGAQYHRACYQQAGDCVFSAQHGDGFEYKPPQPKEDPAAPKNEGGVLCPHCKTVNDARNIFCENCGQPLHAQAQPAGASGTAPPPPPQYGPFSPFSVYGPQRQYTGTISDIPANEWAEFVGSSAPAYLARLSSMERTKRKVSFMISPFFITPMYFAYRKMWFWAAVSLAATVLFTLPAVFYAMSLDGMAVPFGLSTGTWEVLSTVTYYLDIAMRLLFSMFGMYLFKQFAVKKIGAIRKETDGDAAYHDALIRKGGTSVPGVLCAIGLVVLASLGISWFAGDALLTYLGMLV